MSIVMLEGNILFYPIPCKRFGNPVNFQKCSSKNRILKDVSITCKGFGPFKKWRSDLNPNKCVQTAMS